MLLEHGARLPAGERAGFLQVFHAPRTNHHDPDLLNDVESFVADITKGAYAEGYGFDSGYGEYRTFGDESWTVEMDVDGLADLARAPGPHRAEAYRDWVDGLVRAGRVADAELAATRPCNSSTHTAAPRPNSPTGSPYWPSRRCSGCCASWPRPLHSIAATRCSPWRLGGSWKARWPSGPTWQRACCCSLGGSMRRRASWRRQTGPVGSTAHTPVRWSYRSCWSGAAVRQATSAPIPPAVTRVRGEGGRR